MGIEDLPSLSETVSQHGLGANKKLGQHFLLDMNLTDKIARLADPLEGVAVAEIGPGPGGLTRALLLRGATKVVVIEMDDRFIPALAEIGDRAEGRLEIVQGDALRYDIGANLPAPRKIIANLPYNVGTKMLINWVTAQPRFWEQMVLMFQLEVAQRVVAQPGETHYGRLAVLCQSVAQCRMAFSVPDTPFADLKTLGRLTQAAFGQRRKMLRRSLRKLAEENDLVLEDWLGAAGIDPQARPETLPVAAFQALALGLSSGG